MSMTKQGLHNCGAALTAEDLAALARIQAAARQNRRQYAIRKNKPENRNLKPETKIHRPKPTKARKPYFFNPADRD